MPTTVACDPPGAVAPGRGGGPPGRGNESVAVGFPGGLSGESRGAPGGGRGGNGGGGCGCGGVPLTSVLTRCAAGVGVGPSGARGGTDSALGQSLSARSGFSFFSGPFPSFRSDTPRILHPMAGLNRPMELADDLDRFLDGDAVAARATGPWYRLRKTLAKHRRSAAAATVATG